MRRDVLQEDLRRLYGANDMVRADCRGCEGCSDCCRGMGESIILDPLDGYRLKKGLGCAFETLLKNHLELHVVDGVILPNLKMGEGEKCTFLNKEGRCSVHEFRPGICRMFPLGRYYENGSFRYFLQSRECPKRNKGKIRVSKWVDTPNLKQYEEYITKWHYFLEDVKTLTESQGDDQLTRDLNTYLLNSFYLSFDEEEADFYEQFWKKLAQIRKLMGILARKS